MHHNRPALHVLLCLVLPAAAALAQPTINSISPSTLTDRAGDHVAYVVSATPSSGSLAYVWYKTGSSTALSTSNGLVLANIQPSSAGSYYAVVTDSRGSSTSSPVTLNVLATNILPLSSTNLVVARVGDGVQLLSGVTGNTIYLDQYTTNGAYVNSIQIPDEGTGQPYGTGSSSSSSLPAGSGALLVAGGNVSPGNDSGNEAFLTRSPNGRTLNLGGYCQAYPFAGPDVSAEPGGNGGSNWRGLAAVDAYGYYALLWTNSGLYSGGNHQMHGATDMDGNGTNFYTTGEAGSGNGLKYVTTSFEPASGSGLASVAGSFSGTRVAQNIGGNLVYSDGAASTNGLYLCPGLPQTNSSATLLIPDTHSPMDFAASPDLQTIYLADNSAFSGGSTAAGGIQRWDASAGVFRFSYTLGTGSGSTVGARSLAVDFSASSTWGPGVTGARIYATTAETNGNRLLRLVDSGAGSSATLLAAASTNQMLGGVRFGPAVLAPTFVEQPQSQSASLGSLVTFNSLAIGTGPLTYQWYFQANGSGPFSPIAAATNSSYSLNAASNTLGNYYVVVSNINLVSVQSQTATLSLPGLFPVSVSVNTQTPGLTIPPDFLGLSFEEDNLQSNGVGVVGYMFDSSNTQLVTLFTNLGIRNLRIGGISVDTNNLDIPLYTPTNRDIDALFRFARAADVEVILSLRLENGNPAVDAQLAGYTWTNYSEYLQVFAIGNEPDGYGGGDPAITNFNSYLETWTSFASVITNAVPGARFGGPDSSGSGWVGPFVGAQVGSPIVKWIFSHDYVGGDSSGLTPTEIIAGMLSPSWDTNKLPTYFNASAAVAQANGFPYRATEFNSYVAPLPGIWGGNNCFASSLFACDAAHWWAAHGCNGINFHTFLGKYNATIYYDANGNYQIYPIGYGEKAFQIGSQGAVMPLTLTNSAGLNLTAYAVGANTNLWVTIVNKEYGTNARDANVSIVPAGFVNGTVQAMYLTAPGGVGATNGMTLGGAVITNNAPWQGQWTALGGLTNGQCVVMVPNGSAAVVLIQATALFAPPILLNELPAQVRVEAGRAYSYSVAVNGAMPLSYQWYQNGSLVAGATNASYSVTAGAAGSTASYDVVVTNSSGTVTSTVSTLTSIAAPLPLTDYYARQVLNYGPVGYWPLRETNAPAAGNWETNYGTLGRLGNAYYACTNAGSVAFAQPGALAGSSDPCVGLSGGSGNPNSYAFVPRLTAALTLEAPFTLEAWVNMSNNSYCVEIGEGGGTGLNGSADFGGFQMGQGLQTYGNQFQMNYYTGNGNNQTEEQETNLFYAVDEWYHYVVTYDGFNSLIYVNGQEIFGGTTVDAPDTWSPLCVGGGKWDSSMNGAARWFDGSLDEVAVYTNVLSASQITSHYLAGRNASSNYVQTILSVNPLLYYRMDCPGYVNPVPGLFPTALNYGSSAVCGSYPPGIVPGGLAGPPIAALGTNSLAAPINGVVSCVDAGYDPAFNPTGTQPFTAMVWFRTYPADGRTQTIMSHGGAESWALNLIGGSGALMWNSGAGLVVSTNNVNDGGWHFVAGAYDGTRSYLYVDGALNNTGAATHGVTGNTTDDLWLGGDPDYTLVGNNQQYFAGAIAQAAFFTYALSAAQVQAIYQAGILPPPPLALTLGKSSAGAAWQLNWNYGILQSATNVAGPYLDMPLAKPPYALVLTNSQAYFRIRSQ